MKKWTILMTAMKRTMRKTVKKTNMDMKTNNDPAINKKIQIKMVFNANMTMKMIIEEINCIV